MSMSNASLCLFVSMCNTYVLKFDAYVFMFDLSMSMLYLYFVLMSMSNIYFIYMSNASTYVSMCDVFSVCCWNLCVYCLQLLYLLKVYCLCLFFMSNDFDV
jgi:hypothetical protein